MEIGVSAGISCGERASTRLKADKTVVATRARLDRGRIMMTMAMAMTMVITKNYSVGVEVEGNQVERLLTSLHLFENNR